MAKSFVQKFVFDNIPVRGAIVVLTDTWQTISAQREYPAGIEQVLGELLAATSLIGANMAVEGKITAQIQNNPKLDLVIGESTSDLRVRSTAKYDSSLALAEQISYADCVNTGVLVISLETNESGVAAYQSIIALNGNDLAAAFEEYLFDAGKLRNLFIFAYTKTKIVGFTLQELPSTGHDNIDEVGKLFTLARTLTKQELLTQKIATILKQLFNEDDVILFEPHAVVFGCGCGREKVANLLRSLGQQEADSIILEMGKIEITCDFCNATYVFDADDVHNIFVKLDVNVNCISTEIH